MSGLTCVLGFLLGFFIGIGAEETTDSPSAAPQMTVTIEDSTPPADQQTAQPDSTASNPAGLGPTGSAPTGSAPTGSAPTGLGPTGSAPTGSAPTGSDPAGLSPTASAPVGSSAPPGGLGAARTLIVGVDIQPGNYRTTGPVAGSAKCYWARMKSASAQFSDVIAAGMPAGPATVTIQATDKAFQTAGCAEWTKA
ncbi:hypothetical protein [Nonomuraea guangzhouensis]|uniref:Uncharacterized protein n=1 Tax=Nonomuraea guangzhouensis TaxID=1291555 RepID=A0ABW4GC96_9ACTN|nr:hypothetical protein [Nonomuraea guangzhouensis]